VNIKKVFGKWAPICCSLLSFYFFALLINGECQSLPLGHWIGDKNRNIVLENGEK